jgi:phenylalanine-4-hydroxylase
VNGYLDARTFFGLLARRQFPSTTHIRPATSLDYIPSPDIFHDVFGHVPLHAHSEFADLLQRFGELGEAARDDAVLTAVQRLFWFTIEFGMIEGPDGARLYGSGLVSSTAEEVQALGESATRRPFALGAVMATPFDVDAVQPVYYMLRDFGQLRDAVARVRIGEW